MSTPTPEMLRPRGNADTCIKCKRKFNAADRCHPVYIVQSIGKNPLNPLQFGVMLTGEFEMAHEVCEDPQLQGTIFLKR